ncbi:hypothetical protein AU377_07760 [Sporosarcina sp. HYO08]|nr:hypothetical protein AU377_07760 [Sporosarcina sp. HYO08]
MGFQLLNTKTNVQVLIKDGESIQKEQKSAIISGEISTLLMDGHIVFNLKCPRSTKKKHPVIFLHARHPNNSETFKENQTYK